MKLSNYTKNVKVPQNCQITPKVIKLTQILINCQNCQITPKLLNYPNIVKNLNWPDLDLTNTVEPGVRYVPSFHAGSSPKVFLLMFFLRLYPKDRPKSWNAKVKGTKEQTLGENLCCFTYLRKEWRNDFWRNIFS